MAKSNSLINIDGLSKPAVALIEKIGDAIGVLYEPTRIRRKAKAAADAEKIKALANLELSVLQSRAVERLLHQEERKQKNIEAITSQAIDQLTSEAKPENLDEDWVAYFFKSCETVSDKDMQLLWGKLLAGEADSPNTFSKRTIDFVASMDKKDALLFTRLGRCVWFIGHHIPLIFDTSNEYLKKLDLTFSNLKHLESIGLISSELGGYSISPDREGLAFDYFDQLVILESPDGKGFSLNLGKVIFTSIGRELFPICGASMDSEYFHGVLKRWREDSFIVRTPGYSEKDF